MSASDTKNSHAPTTAHALPHPVAHATIVAITTTYAATGPTSAGAVRRSARTRRNAHRDRDGHRDHRTDEQLTAGAGAEDEADDVGEVGEEERREAGHEPPLAREHEEHVARERQHQRDHERDPHVGVDRIESEGHRDEAGGRERLGDVLDHDPAGADGEPVDERRHCRSAPAAPTRSSSPGESRRPPPRPGIGSARAIESGSIAWDDSTARWRSSRARPEVRARPRPGCSPKRVRRWSSATCSTSVAPRSPPRSVTLRASSTSTCATSTSWAGRGRDRRAGVRARHRAGQQRGHLPVSRLDGDVGRAVPRGVRGQPGRSAPRDAGGGAVDAAGRRRVDRQRLVDQRPRRGTPPRSRTPRPSGRCGA